MLWLSGCTTAEREKTDLQVDLVTEPSPPKVGPTELSLWLASAEGQPLENAAVRVEGNMNHAGMKPSFAEMTEGEPGAYSGTLDLTMAGDWFLLVNVTTVDGETIEHKIDLPGVKAP